MYLQNFTKEFDFDVLEKSEDFFVNPLVICVVDECLGEMDSIHFWRLFKWIWFHSLLFFQQSNEFKVKWISIETIYPELKLSENFNRRIDDYNTE